MCSLSNTSWLLQRLAQSRCSKNAFWMNKQRNEWRYQTLLVFFLPLEFPVRIWYSIRPEPVPVYFSKVEIEGQLLIFTEEINKGNGFKLCMRGPSGGSKTFLEVLITRLYLKMDWISLVHFKNGVQWLLACGQTSTVEYPGARAPSDCAWNYLGIFKIIAFLDFILKDLT